jgi:hypothetical protein
MCCRMRRRLCCSASQGWQCEASQEQSCRITCTSYHRCILPSLLDAAIVSASTPCVLQDAAAAVTVIDSAPDTPCTCFVNCTIFSLNSHHDWLATPLAVLRDVCCRMPRRLWCTVSQGWECGASHGQSCATTGRMLWEW